MEIREIEAIIEGLLFAAGDVLSLEKIAEVVEVDKKTVKSIISNMIINFQNSSRGVIIREINNGYQLCTRAEHYEYIRKLFEPRQKQGLSQAAFETLAIIAHNQPVTKAKIEQIRGVSSESAITRLLERNLIKEAGRMDCPGKPILFETTEEFLRCFGFRSVAEVKEVEISKLHPELQDESINYL